MVEANKNHPERPTMAEPMYFAWIDLEATGQDKKLDPILEIGLVLTGVSYPYTEVASYEAIIMPDDPHWMDRLQPNVFRMHTLNGLLDDVWQRGRPSFDVENEIISLLMKYGRPHNFMTAGSAVSHYDRPMIENQMPRLNKWFQPPSLDVGSIRRGLKFSGRRDLEAYGQTFVGSDKPHRGPADIRDHLNEWRQYASMFIDIPKEG